MMSLSAVAHFNYGKTFPNRPTTRPALNDLFSAVAGYGSYNGIVQEILWDLSEAIDIEDWAVWGSGRLERCYCI